MTIAQIYAILTLLLAFGAPQATIDNVKTVLLPNSVHYDTTSTYTGVQAPIQVATPQVVSTSTPTQPVCSPTLTWSADKTKVSRGDVVQYKGVYESNCYIDPSTIVTLQDSHGLGKITQTVGDTRHIASYFGVAEEDKRVTVTMWENLYGDNTSVLTIGDLTATTSVQVDNQ